MSRGCLEAWQQAVPERLDRAAVLVLECQGQRVPAQREQVEPRAPTEMDPSLVSVAALSAGPRAPASAHKADPACTGVGVEPKQASRAAAAGWQARRDLMARLGTRTTGVASGRTTSLRKRRRGRRSVMLLLVSSSSQLSVSQWRNGKGPAVLGLRARPLRRGTA